MRVRTGILAILAVALAALTLSATPSANEAPEQHTGLIRCIYRVDFSAIGTVKVWVGDPPCTTTPDSLQWFIVQLDPRSDCMVHVLAQPFDPINRPYRSPFIDTHQGCLIPGDIHSRPPPPPVGKIGGST